MSSTKNLAPTREPITIGVLLLPFHQHLDSAGPVDLLSSFTPFYLSKNDIPLPFPPIPFEFLYITLSADLSPVSATSGPQLIPTHTLASCPAHLSALLIPGPPPNFPISPELQTFLDHHCAPDSGTTILTVCTGSLVLGRAGLLRGIRATGNKLALRAVAAEARTWGVEWVREGRWVVGDKGRVWTSAGVTAGMDMVAGWMRAGREEGGLGVDLELLEAVFGLMEFTPKERGDDRFGYLLDGVEL